MTTIDKVRDLMNQQQELLEEAIALFHCESNNSYIFCFALNQETTIERRYRADRIMQKKHEFLTRFQKIKINLAEYFPEEAISKMETSEKFPAGIYFYPDLEEGEEPVREPEQKLPEVGRSYRHIKNHDLKQEIIAFKKEFFLGRVVKFKSGRDCPLNAFWLYWEEIEDHKEEEKSKIEPEEFYKKYSKEFCDEACEKLEKAGAFKEEEKPTPYIDSIHKEKDSIHSGVDKALEELKRGIFNFRCALQISAIDEDSAVAKFTKLAQNLVNALEKD